uniref:uncharacterized protein LOC105349548 n=1 Tax=Fragaria vesca subsp. vesca TaxID=101020 RepID=UPI0005CA9455|nr:PREDICTED: uncharacterized protein LOC105349548 [Fragaria vesca subsp. vesca]XP_011457734.1 PREDICTED: uncharacterized protein LOC105349548 [Fragaria vesca subsp. vesca]
MSRYNPSSSLEIQNLAKRPRTYPTLTTMQHPYYLPAAPPEDLSTDIEQLRYITYQPFIGRHSIATIQEFENLEDAEEHWKTQRRYDSTVLIHPDECIMREGKHVLIFEGVIREFLVWVEKAEVTDADMNEILHQIGKNLKYLVSVKRPHGNLRRGIGVTPDLKVYFFNLGADATRTEKRRKSYKDDVQALHDFLVTIESKLKEGSEYVTRWKKFLSTSCLDPPISPPIWLSPIHPRYCDNHVIVAFNYPASWDVQDKLRFVANMHALCTDKANNSNSSPNLIKHPEFVKYFATRYADWPSKLTGMLNQVYQFGYQ